MSIYLINESVHATGPGEDDIENVKYHAEQGNVEAQYHLALIYDTGKGLPRSPRDAEKYYKQAAAQGHAGAQYYLSRLYSTKNSGIRKDEKEALRLLKLAAEQGYAEAVRALAS